MSNNDFDQILSQIGAGERASSKLMDMLYAELREMAGRLMKRERGDHTMQPTALVHEAFLRLVNADKVGEQGQLHFLDAAAVTMRRVLVDHARAAGAAKRGGGEQRNRITLQAIGDSGSNQDVDILTLHTALKELSGLDERQAKIVELRFFGGMSGKQIAEHFAVSRNTIVRELTLARAWLRRRIAKLDG
ncbi:MAG: RNA polymerase sigma-70 factor (ECF subfamily) [Planctomycetota bacterium]|jgi:RNA polymerase sigma-70 factor (ECF subfamily)